MQPLRLYFGEHWKSGNWNIEKGGISENIRKVGSRTFEKLGILTNFGIVRKRKSMKRKNRNFRKHWHRRTLRRRKNKKEISENIVKVGIRGWTISPKFPDEKVTDCDHLDLCILRKLARFCILERKSIYLGQDIGPRTT